MKAWVPFDELVGTAGQLNVTQFPDDSERREARGVRFAALPHPFVPESLGVIRDVPNGGHHAL